MSELEELREENADLRKRLINLNKKYRGCTIIDTLGDNAIEIILITVFAVAPLISLFI